MITSCDLGDFKFTRSHQQLLLKTDPKPRRCTIPWRRSSEDMFPLLTTLLIVHSGSAKPEFYGEEGSDLVAARERRVTLLQVTHQ